jgi:hypothetical protein
VPGSGATQPTIEPPHPHPASVATTVGQCGLLLGYDPATGAPLYPVAGAAWHGHDIAVAWLPFCDGRDEPWRAIITAGPGAPQWDDVMTESAASTTLLGLELVDVPAAAHDLRGAAELLVDELLAAPAGLIRDGG